MPTVLLISDREQIAYYKSFAAQMVPSSWGIKFALEQEIGDGFLSPGFRERTGVSAVICTTESVCKKVFKSKTKVSLGNYYGSFKRLANEIDFLVIAPLTQKWTVNYWEFMTKRHLAKLFKPADFLTPSPFTFLTPDLDPQFFQKLLLASESADLMAVDTETGKENLSIRICGISTLNYSTGKNETFSWPIRSLDDVAIMRAVLDSRAEKIFQNGQYDMHYFARFNCWPRSGTYKWDTLHLFHAWLAELPKDLAFISAFAVRDFYYWKDEGKSASISEQLQYNAKDCWATLWSMLSLISIAPSWVKTNYAQTFPKIFPSLSCAFAGIKVDEKIRDKLLAQGVEEVNEIKNSIAVQVGTPSFNPASPQQVQRLLKVLKVKDANSSDKKHIEKAIKEHQLNSRILSSFAKFRKTAKLVSTYYGVKLLHGRWMFTLNPAGTETARFSSGSSSFWCGTQVQNAPPAAKQMMQADEGWQIGEADFRQAETRWTGYLADDVRLIKAVEESPDFHSANASAFFGISFAKIWDTTLGKTLDKALRDLAKRINHGVNYNMGVKVFIETMGEEALWKACDLLSLRAKFLKKIISVEFIVDYLLGRFDASYPKIRHDFQEQVKKEVSLTGKMRSVRGWVRVCFGWKDSSKPIPKPDLNALIAHGPQNGSGMLLNDAFEISWWELHDPANFRIIAPVHDSILFQTKGEVGLAKIPKLDSLMTIPVFMPHTGKTMIVPVDINHGKTYWSELK